MYFDMVIVCDSFFWVCGINVFLLFMIVVCWVCELFWVDDVVIVGVSVVV